MIAESAIIHPTAIIEPGAIIGDNVSIGPFCCIGDKVEIGANTLLKSHIVITGKTRIGCDNQIFQFASIGEVNQDLKYRGEPTCVEIGDRNLIRESVTIHRGTTQGGGVTRLGCNNLLMVNTHIAHDCLIGDHTIFANNATLGGHVVVGDYAIIGGMSAVHQFCHIGVHALVGGCSGVAQDVPPFVIAQGNHASPFGVNIEGLKRRGFDKETIQIIRFAYQLLYRSGKSLEEVQLEMAEQAITQPIIGYFSDFLKQSTRGIIR